MLRGIQAIVVRNDVSRQLGEVFLPGARKTYITDDPSTLFDFELGDEHYFREEVGHRVRPGQLDLLQLAEHLTLEVADGDSVAGAGPGPLRTGGTPAAK